MVRRRALLSGLLVVLHMTLVATVSFSAFDFSWSPSYFDDDDDDFLTLMTERVPLVALEILPPIPTSVTSAPIVLLGSSVRSLLPSGLSRLRAPPLS